MKREDEETGNGTNKSPQRFLVEEQAKPLNVFSVTNVKKKMKLEKYGRVARNKTIIVLRVSNIKHGICLFC